MDVKSINDYKKSNDTELRHWVAKKQRDEQFDKYVNKIMAAVKASAGVLSTDAVVSAIFESIGDYFQANSGRSYPWMEIANFSSRSAHRVLILGAVWVLDWRALGAHALGVGKITIGAMIALFTFPGVTNAVSIICQEGIDDMMFGITSAIFDSFAWDEYAGRKFNLMGKLRSAGIAVLTCGLSAYFVPRAPSRGVKYLKEAAFSLLMRKARNIRIQSSAFISGFIVPRRSISRWLKAQVFDLC